MDTTDSLAAKITALARAVIYVRNDPECLRRQELLYWHKERDCWERIPRASPLGIFLRGGRNSYEDFVCRFQEYLKSPNEIKILADL